MRVETTDVLSSFASILINVYDFPIVAGMYLLTSSYFIMYSSLLLCLLIFALSALQHHLQYICTQSL